MRLPALPTTHNTPYYTQQIIANLRFLYPAVAASDIAIETAPGLITVRATVAGDARVTLLTRRHLLRQEAALRELYRVTRREAARKVRMLGRQEGAWWAWWK